MVSLEVWVLAGMGCVGIMNNDNNIDISYEKGLWVYLSLLC